MNHFINTKIKAVRLLSIVPTISVLIFSATYINRVYAVKKKNNKAVQQKEISKKHSLKLLSKNNVDNIAESNKSSVTEAVVQISSSGEIALNQTISQKPTENPNPTNNQTDNKVETSENNVSVDSSIDNKVPTQSNDNSTQNISDSDSVPSLDGRMLNRGRIIVPSLHVSVAVADAWYCDSQAEIDKEDEAVDYNDEDWCSPDDTRVVADHAYQTGETFKKSVPGKTKLYWYRPDGTVETYLCRSIDPNGINDPESGVRTSDGLRWGGWKKDNPGDLALYTCNSTTGIPITIIFWTRIA